MTFAPALPRRIELTVSVHASPVSGSTKALVDDAFDELAGVAEESAGSLASSAIGLESTESLTSVPSESVSPASVSPALSAARVVSAPPVSAPEVSRDENWTTMTAPSTRTSREMASVRTSLRRFNQDPRGRSERFGHRTDRVAAQGVSCVRPAGKPRYTPCVG